MITACQHKPHFGNAEIIPGVSIPKFALLLNEGGGNIVYDFIKKKPYNFDSSYRPKWGSNGALFEANYQHIDGPLLNDIFSANGNGTVLMGYKKTVTPSGYYYALTVGSTYSIFCFCWTASNIEVYMNSQYTSITTSNFQNNRVVGISWNYNSGTNVRLFGNGIYLGNGTIVAGMPTSANPINIGARTDNTDRYAGGEIEWMYFWDRQLTDIEIRYYSMNPYWFLYSISEQSIMKSFYVVAAGVQSAVTKIMQSMNQFGGGM